MSNRSIARFRAAIARLLDPADVRLDGDRPWDLQVRDPRLFGRLLRQGSLALGESYVEGWWDCDRLDGLIHRVLRAGLDRKVRTVLWPAIQARVLNLQAPSRAFTVGRRHYDLGNELFRRMLDRRMIYSCAYWEGADDLDAAQEAKLELVFRKLDLAPGMTVLDIGCGWGGALALAAERHGVRGVGVTVSREQATLARQICAGLPVEIRLQDYRELRGRFDRIFSLGMFEHVGFRNYRTFLRVVRGLLPTDGLFLLHTIGRNTSGTTTDPWIARHIFPNSMIPSARQIAAAAEGVFVLEDWHGFGTHYDRTLMEWHRRFERAWDDLRAAYGEPFRRLWRYYLLSCAGAFRARSLQVWQVLLSPEGIPGGCRPVR